MSPKDGSTFVVSQDIGHSFLWEYLVESTHCKTSRLILMCRQKWSHLPRGLHLRDMDIQH